MKSAFVKIGIVLLSFGVFFNGCTSKKTQSVERKRPPEAARLFHHKGVLSVYPIGNHRILSIGRDSLMIVWQADSGWALSGKKMPKLPEEIGPASGNNLCWIVCKGGVFYQVSLNDLSIKQSVPSILTNILHFEYSPISSAFWGVGRNEIFRFDPGSNQVRILFALQGQPAAIGLHRFQPLLAVFRSDRIEILDARTQKRFKMIILPNYKKVKDPERFVAFIGEHGLVASYGENLWMGDWQKGKMQLLAKHHHAPITALAVSANDSLIATGSMDKSIKLWHWPQGDLRGSFYGHFLTVNALSFADSGRKLISGSEDGTLVIWNLKTKLQEKRLGSLKIAMKNPWQLKIQRVRYARSFKVGNEEYNVSDSKTRLIKVTAELKNTGLSDLIFFSSNLFLTAPDQTRFHCVGLENYVALSPKAYFKRRIAPNKSLKGNFIFIIEPPYEKYSITYETLNPIPLKNY